MPDMRRAASVLVLVLLAAVLGCGGSGTAPATQTPAGDETAAPAPAVDLSTVAEPYKPEFNADPRLPGVYVQPNPGLDGKLLTSDDFSHLGNGIRYPLCSDADVAANRIAGCYNSNPPTSGPHAVAPAAFKVYDFAVPKENLVHNMEHGGVVIWYSTTNAGAIALLAQIAGDALAAGKLVVMSPYPDMEADSIAITSWTRLDKFKSADLTPQRVQDFIAANEKRFNPEGF
jgi:hypothetical protein